VLAFEADALRRRSTLAATVGKKARHRRAFLLRRQVEPRGSVGFERADVNRRRDGVRLHG